MSITLTINGSARPGKRDALFAAFERHLGPRALADDAQAVVVWSALDDPDGFQLFEVYTDPSAAAANAKADWFAAYVAEARPLLAGPPTMTQGVPRWTKGIVG
jgi:quinol monooxygenase YgiN